MATVTIARPSQALRNRRDAPRPTAAKRNSVMVENGDATNKRRKLDEPFVRTPEHILRKFKDSKPSLTLHLYPTHFKFEGQDGSFPYEGDMNLVLKHLKHQTVPHEMAEELLTNNVTWYDGCLIVEVHSYRSVEGKGKTRHDSAVDDNTEKFGMHNWNNGLTPSPMVPYPSQAKQAEEEEKKEQTNGEMAAPERPKEKDGPKVFSLVLFPTELSKHHEMLVLANTPASELRGKKRSGDNATPSSAHPPPTPQMSVPPTPITQSARTASTQSQKMCIEEGDLYSFHADLLLTTEPPLYLEPVDNPQDAGRLLDFLSDPRYQELPPSPKTRKKTTAEVAADDALKQETERRMLIMDERIKPVGTGAAQNDNQTAPSSLTFSRFKTIDMVRQRLAQQEEEKKEQELRMVAEKRAADEQATLAAQSNAAKQRAREAMLAQQQGSQQHATMLMAQQQHQNQLRQRAMQVAQQNAQLNQQGHAHPQQNVMMQNQQQAFQNQTSMPQSSPVVRNQTPMMNSSPMMPQGGFPMAQTSSQQGGAGSPGRPQSAVMQNPMARQVSQQQQASRNATPQMPQGTPSMAQAVPNRQMTQTPRMQPNSPAPGMQQGTPNMPMQTPQMGNQAGLTQEQIQMLRQQQQNVAMVQAQQNGQAGSPPQNMTPEQFQAIQRQHNQQQAMHRNQVLQAQANAGDPAAIQQLAQLRANQQQQRMVIQQRQAMMAAQRAQMGGQAGSPGAMPQQTPQMGHAHPQQQQMPGQQGGNMPDPSQMTPQQQQALQHRAAQIAAQRANHQQINNNIRSLAQKFGSLNQIPPQVFQQLPQPVQQQIHLLRQQQAQKVQQQAMQQQQQQQQNGGEQVPGGQGNPEYMQQLRNNRAMLGQAMAQNQAQQQQQGQGAMAGMNGMTGLSFQMGGIQQNNAFGNQQNGGDLSQQFAAMQNALTRGTQGGGQGGQGMQ